MTFLALEDLTSRYGCDVVGEQPLLSQSFDGIAPLGLAGPSHISFLVNEKYLGEALSSKAGAILCSRKGLEELQGKTQATLLACEEPYVVFARVAQHFFRPVHPYRGASEWAFIDATAKVDTTAVLFPFVFVGPGAVIEANVVLYPGVFVGAGAHIGKDSILYPNAVVREGCTLGERCILNPGAVIGGDGFGFAPSGMENVKIPQIGGVVLANDVEVGSNSSIDRGTMDDTRIGEQTKIDSLVQIGHNTVVGKACFLAGQSGVAGSCTLGDRVTLAGQVGVCGHVKIGDFVTVLAKSGVSKNILDKGMYNGIPAKPNREYLRQMAVFNRMTAPQSAKEPKKKESDSS